MTEEQKKALDAVADRCGDLYQAIGRLGIEHGIDVEPLLDEALAITESVEAASGRKAREDAAAAAAKRSRV